MSTFNILNQMIKESAKIPLGEEYGKKMVTLSEPQQPNINVVIKNMPERSIVIKADAFISPDKIFNGNYGECKRADYIIVSEKDTKKVIVFIELKKTKDSEKGIIQQLKGAHCLAYYLQETGKCFWNETSFLNGFKHLFISISHISLNKHKTRYERREAFHDKPEKMLKIAWPNNLQFNHLSGGK